MKASYIISNFPVIALLTLFIYPLVTGIMLCAKNQEFKSPGYAIACGVLSILGFGLFLVTFIMGFFLEEKKPSSSAK